MCSTYIWANTARDNRLLLILHKTFQPFSPCGLRQSFEKLTSPDVLSKYVGRSAHPSTGPPPGAGGGPGTPGAVGGGSTPQPVPPEMEQPGVWLSDSSWYSRVMSSENPATRYDMGGGNGGLRSVCL